MNFSGKKFGFVGYFSYNRSGAGIESPEYYSFAAAFPAELSGGSDWLSLKDDNGISSRATNARSKASLIFPHRMVA